MHFFCLVIDTEGYTDIDSVLERYIESNESFFEFKESYTTPEEIKNAADEIIQIHYLKNNISLYSHYTDLHLAGDYKEIVKEWEGLTENEETGALGCWCNPWGKFDWYNIGGRWDGFFFAKREYEDEFEASCPRIYKGSEVESRPRFTSLPKYAIDFEAMHAAWSIELREQYKYRKRVLTHELQENPNGGGTLSAYAQVVQDKTEDEYILENKTRPFIPDNIVIDGIWESSDSLGPDEGLPEIAWEAFFWSTIENLHEDAYLTIVDCHV